MCYLWRCARSPLTRSSASCHDRSKVRSSSTSATRPPTGRRSFDRAPEVPERARRALRRHGPGGVVSVRRTDQHADDGPAGGQRIDLLAVAHHRAVLTHTIDVPHRAQPPFERLRHDLGVVDRLPRLQLAHPARERHDGEHPARRRLVDVLGRQEPQRPDRRVDDGSSKKNASDVADDVEAHLAAAMARD